MKLFYSPTSPFVRKVMATAIAAGVDEQIERVTTNPWESPAGLIAQNPLAKVPCLVTEDGLALFDSKVICDYLASLGDGTLMPAAGPARWRVLKQQALADGMVDAAIIRRNEAARPEEAARAKNMERQRQIVADGLAALEADPPIERLDVGTIAIACCLGYLDLRFAHEPWREAHPRLAAFYAGVGGQAAIARTAPPPG